MLISEFDYELPEELIAQNPLKKRESSRMLMVDRSTENLRDEYFYDFPQFIFNAQSVCIQSASKQKLPKFYTSLVSKGQLIKYLPLFLPNLNFDTSPLNLKNVLFW